MSDKINQLIELAEKAKEAGHYALAMKYINLALELAQQENDKQAIVKCLAIMNSITKILNERKEDLDQKAKAKVQKEVAASALFSLLTGKGTGGATPKKTKKKDKPLERIAKRISFTEEYGDIGEDDDEVFEEELSQEIYDRFEDIKLVLDEVCSSMPSLGESMPEVVEKQKTKARKKSKLRREVKEEAEPARPAPKPQPIGAAPPKPPAAGAAPSQPLAGPPAGRPPGGPPGAPARQPTLAPPMEKPAAAPPPPATTSPMIPPSLPRGGLVSEDAKSEEEAEAMPADEAMPDERFKRADEAKAEEGARRPKKLKRFGDVSAPMEMTEKKEYIVKVGLRVFKAAVVGMPVPMEVTVPSVGPPIVEVLVISPDFKVDQPRRSLIVPLETDSDILNFRVTPLKEGVGNLTVEFYQEGTLIGRAILKIVIRKKKEAVNESLSSTSVTVASQFGTTRLDATLRIVRYGSDFFFSLFTPRATAVVSQSSLFGKASVNMNKVNKLEEKMEEAVFDRGNPRAALVRLKELGAQIYNAIPKAIRHTIESIDPKYLMIETGDLLVPWELAFDGEDFLCAKFCLGKRVFDETRDFRPPPFCIGKKILDLTFIGASPKGVTPISVNKELELFSVYEQTKRINLTELVEPNAKKLKVLEVLGQSDMFHFTCHGKFDEKDPLESALLLSDGILTADEIDDMEMNNWPLIFANACSTGAISDKIKGVGGIARAFLEAGAIAFLGPLFEIPDDIAVDFAKEFYSSLLYDNEDLGTAIVHTRAKLREKYGGAFWAIFSLYGDPTLTLCKA